MKIAGMIVFGIAVGAIGYGWWRWIVFVHDWNEKRRPPKPPIRIFEP
jgi:hypothetical protein